MPGADPQVASEAWTAAVAAGALVKPVDQLLRLALLLIAYPCLFSATFVGGILLILSYRLGIGGLLPFYL
ncbi:MAG: hypothetical protein WBX26_05135 [Candidatus Cybelea sp.]